VLADAIANLVSTQQKLTAAAAVKRRRTVDRAANSAESGDDM
jgi:hypothetical protein